MTEVFTRCQRSEARRTNRGRVLRRVASDFNSRKPVKTCLNSRAGNLKVQSFSCLAHVTATRIGHTVFEDPVVCAKQNTTCLSLPASSRRWYTFWGEF